MNNSQLTLICHARSDAQRVGRFHLEEEGVLVPLASPVALDGQARTLVAPEWRTRQTAELLGLAAQPEPALRDCDLGRWQGLSLKHLAQDEPDALQHWLHDPQAAPHGGESVAQLCQRVADWLEGWTASGHWQAITHPMVIRAALMHVLQCPPTAFQHIDVLALSRVSFSRYDRWRLRIE